MSQNYYWPPNGASNASVSANGSTIPLESTLIGGKNGSGNLTPVSVDASGNINVNVENFPGGTLDVNLTKVGGAAIAEGQTTMSASIPVAIASDQSAVPVSQSGTWNVNNITGTVSLPTGAATSANQATEITSLSTIATNTTNLNNTIAAPGAIVPSDAIQVAGSDGTDLRTLSTDSSGKLNVNIENFPGGTLQVDIEKILGSAPSATNAIPSQLTDGTSYYDARQIRTLTSSDVVTANQGGTWNITNISGTISLPTGAATSANQTNASQKTQIVDGSANVISSTGNALDVNLKTSSITLNTSSQTAGTAQANAPIYNDYTSTSITTAAYTQLVASTSNTINTIHIFDSSGQAMIFATGGAGSEVDQLYVQPGGDIYTFNIPAGTRISYKAKTATASAGYLIMSFLK